MTKKEMLKVIYEKVATKIEVCIDCGNSFPNPYGECSCSINGSWKTKEFPVMIGDVFDYIEKQNLKNSIGKSDTIKIHNIKVMVDKLWKEKRKSIEEQHTQCIEYIYNLIK